jgi:hypothetical protein
MRSKFTDHGGSAWTIADYRLLDTGPQPVTLNHHSGEYRTFVADHEDAILVYRFGDRSYRTIEPNVLEGQLLFARRIARSTRGALSLATAACGSPCLARRKRIQERAEPD